MKIKKNLHFLFVVMMAFVCQYAFAQSECDQYTSSYDKTYCVSKLFFESDKELNSTYKELQGMVKGATKQQLVMVQRDWIKYRDQACSSNQGAINVDCNYDINRERTEYLRDRLRECKVGSCRQDMIGSKSW